MAEQFANDIVTTLDGGINSSQTSLTVLSSTGFPSSGNFRIRIDDELLLVTAVSGTTWTVTRAIESTSATSHSTGATVAHVLTRGSLLTLQSDYNLYGSLASMPAAGQAGRKYWPSDSYYQFVDDGSEWQAFYQGRRVKRPGPISGWTKNNQTTSTMDDFKGALRIKIEEPTPANTFRSITKTPPATPFTVEMCILSDIPGQLTASAGLCVRRSGGTEWHMSIGPGGNSLQYINAFSNYSGFQDVTEKQMRVIGILPAIWWKFADSGTARWLGYSFDGFQWHYLISNVSSGAYWTQGGNTAYDGLGFLCWSNGADYLSAVMLHYEEFNSVIL